MSHTVEVTECSLEKYRRIRREQPRTLSSEQVAEILNHAGRPVQSATDNAQLAEIHAAQQEIRHAIEELRTMCTALNARIDQYNAILEVQQHKIKEIEARHTHHIEHTKQALQTIVTRKGRPDNLAQPK